MASVLVQTSFNRFGIVSDKSNGPEKKYRAILEGIGDGYYEVDLEGFLTLFNGPFCRISGYPEDELRGKNFRELSDDRNVRKVFGRFKKVYATGVPSIGFVWEMIRKDSTKRLVEISMSLMTDSKGGKTGFRGIARDVTKRKQDEEAWKKAKEKAEAANQAKSVFLASMSHEIRTPMNGIIGMTDLTLGTNLNKEQREYLTMVKTSANSLLGLLNDLLDLAKIESGKIELEKIDFDLRTTLEHAIQTVMTRATEAGLDLVCRLDPEVPTALIGDPSRLRQILVNLLGNAVKFTEKGRVAVEVKTEKEEDSSLLLHFSVSDTGIGIPPEKLNTIFESFRQADGSISRNYQGTGLGLSISKELVGLMGGDMWVESDLGKGSTFHFTVYYELSKKDENETFVLKEKDLSGLQVLILDNNATSPLILHEMISSWGLQPTEVADGKQALTELERAHRAGQPYQLLLLDLEMSESDGFKVAERIREDPRHSDLEIILITSLGMKGDAERCKEIGINGYFVKPVKESELLAGIMLVASRPLAQKESIITRHTVEDAKRRLKILLVEDNVVNQKLAAKMLENRGHHVHIASNGQKAIDALTRECYDLVLMDIQMSEMDGLEATGRIREREKQEGSHIPIVAMTAHAMKGDKERCLAAGMDDYLSKPIIASDLFDMIDRWGERIRRISKRRSSFHS